VERDDREDILEATREMLAELIRVNRLDRSEVASAIFTTTPDLTSEYPAIAARQLGWFDVPLLCCYDQPVKGALQGLIRVLIHYNAHRPQSEFRWVYLRRAVELRKDLESLETQLGVTVPIPILEETL
jgi:chorismate mutase